MKLRSPRSIESWLFWIGAVLLLLAGLLYGFAEIVAAAERARVPKGETLGIAAIYLMVDLPMWVLEFAAFACLMVAALISAVRTFLPTRPR